MKVYKIKHKPTGLWYQPKKGRYRGEQTHFGPNGKVYIARKPKFKDIKHYLCISDSQVFAFRIKTIEEFGQQVVEFMEEDWEIIEYELVETIRYNELLEYKYMYQDLAK